jgi:hypothetical protein
MEQHPSPHSAPLTPYEAAAQVIAGFPPAKPRARVDGWTPERQRAFCEALADCGVVRTAAAQVGMTPQSAYELKRKPEGKGFALAWAAAMLLARPRLVDLAIERAVDGNVEQYVKDGEIVGERRKQDVRHLLAAITRLENVQNGDFVIATIADDFDTFLDSMEAEANVAAALPPPQEPAPKGKRKTKAPPSPLLAFFEERECDPGMEGHEFEAVLSHLARAKSAAKPQGGGTDSTAPQKKGNADDDIWSDWDRDPFDPDNF